MFFPMSCMSPLTVPITTEPLEGPAPPERCGSIRAIASLNISADITSSERKYSLTSNRRPTSDMPLLNCSTISSRFHPRVQRLPDRGKGACLLEFDDKQQRCFPTI